MYKISTLILISAVLSVCLSACDTRPSNSMVTPQRRFAKYLEPEENKGGVVDLSEGQKIKYEANFGSQNPSFDFKIVNPY